MQYIYLNGKEKNNPELVLIRGVQGSGKSTMAAKIAKLGYQHHENDFFFTDENGVYAFDFSKHSQAKEETLKGVEKDLKDGKNVVVANTFNTMADLKPYIEMAEKTGARLNVIGMKLKFKSVHNIPEEVVEKALKTYEHRNIDQNVTSENVALIYGFDQVQKLMSQDNLHKGYTVPTMLIKDSLEKMRLSVNALTNKWYNAEKGNKQLSEVLSQDLIDLKEMDGFLNVGVTNDLLDKLKNTSGFVRDTMVPRELVKILSNKNELSKEVNSVLVDYFVNADQAEIKDAEISKKIYKEVFSLNVEPKKKRTLRMA